MKYEILFLVLLMPYSARGYNLDAIQPVTVDYVNLEKYIGVWYEIAKIPNRFQRKCTSNTTATYRLREDGRIDVINRCTKSNGDVVEAKGIAKIVDKNSNAKLKVSFVRILGISLFWGDYWILGLERDYKFAIVGTPSKKYGWILSRTPELSEAELKEAFHILEKQGYNPNDFIMTPQNN